MKAVSSWRRGIATGLLVVVGLVLILLPRLVRPRSLVSLHISRPLTFRATGINPVTNYKTADVWTAPTCPESSEIARALATVPDPELGLGIVELGLVESIAVGDSGRIRVVLILTTPVCPYGPGIARAALDAVVRVPGVSSAEVAVNPHAAWDPARASEEVRRKLGLVSRP